MSAQNRPQGRPLSPHLQVYRPQMTMVLSITHRMTGVALTVGSLLFVYWLIAAASGAGAFETAQAFIGSWFGLLLLFGWSLALFYHLCNGIRHLFWDAGLGYVMADAERSGIAVLISAGLLTLVAWIAGLISWGSA